MVDLITVKLEEICTQVTDGTHDSPKLISHGYPLIKGKDINKGYIDFENCDYISEEDHLKVISRSKPEYGDILFANIGNSIGDMAFVSTTKEFSIKNVALIKADITKVDNLYLYYYMLNKDFQNEIKSTKQGAAQPFISLNLLRNFELKINKKLKIQTKIAKVLSNYDDLIENNNKRIKILEEMAQKIYKEWFVDFKFPGHETTTFKQTDFGKIPSEWNVCTLNDVANIITRGVTPQYEEGSKRYVINQKVNRGLCLDLSNLKELASDLIVPNEKYATKGDILINSLGEGTIGRVHYYNDKNHYYAVDQHMTICRLKEFLPEYTYLYLASSDGQARFAGLKTGATNMTMLNISLVRDFKIVIPTKTVLQQFSKLIKNLFDLKSIIEYKNQTLKQTRDLLLPRLFSGEIDVENLEVL